MKPRKFRPLLGSPLSVCWLMSVDCSARVVSTTGESDVTVICSCTEASCSTMGMLAVWPTTSSMPSWV